jgi:hypothetical protein
VILVGTWPLSKGRRLPLCDYLPVLARTYRDSYPISGSIDGESSALLSD